VSGETTADLELRQDGHEIVFVPTLVRIAKDEVEWPLECGNEIVGVRQPGVDVVREAGLPEVGHSLPVEAFVDLYGDEFSARFAERPGDPDPRVAGGRADI